MILTPIAAITLGLACADAGPAVAEFEQLAIPLVYRPLEPCEPLECNRRRQAAPRQQPTVIYRERRAARPQESQAELARRAAEPQAEINDR